MTWERDKRPADIVKVGQEIKVKITLPENVTEVIKQQKINTLYDLLSKSSNSSEKNTEFKKIS